MLSKPDRIRIRGHITQQAAHGHDLSLMMKFVGGYVGKKLERRNAHQPCPVMVAFDGRLHFIFKVFKENSYYIIRPYIQLADHVHIGKIFVV